MEIKTVVRLVSGSYHSEISLNENGLTPVETETINYFGAPLIECGGAFGVTGSTGATGTNTYFELEADPRYFPTNFPVKQTFSLLDYPVGTTAPPNAAQRAVIWKDEIVSRITAGMQDKRDEASSTAIGTAILNIDTTPVI